MDADRFDALSRALTTPGSRRTTLRALLGTLLGSAALGSSSIALATHEGCRHAGSACTRPGQCCANKCLNSGKCSCDAKNRCPEPPNPCKKAVCSSGRCLIQNKPPGARCSNGTSCTTGDACDGNGRCVGTPDHTRCRSADPCLRGRCRPSDPTRDAKGCVLVPITSDACGPSCAQTCAQSGITCCGSPGSCVDLNTDETNCGTCGNQCLGGEVCSSGACLCASGNVVCGEACVAGSCCDVYADDPGINCADGQECCSPNGCKDVQNDMQNCGGCGIPCDPARSNICSEGKCLCKFGFDISEISECIGGEQCDGSAGCKCPGGDEACESVCKGIEAKCGSECLNCPPPPPSIGLPGSDPGPGFCCETHSECSCGGDCCLSKDDCFQTIDSKTNKAVKEFCCSQNGGTVCGDQCCKTSDCASGCVRLFPVGGSYRRPGR